MKKIRYGILGYTSVFNAENGQVEERESLAMVTVAYSETAEETAKQVAYNGEYEVFDDGEPEQTTPAQLDVIEAQVTYTAMMTDTLLEV